MGAVAHRRLSITLIQRFLYHVDMHTAAGAPQRRCVFCFIDPKTVGLAFCCNSYKSLENLCWDGEVVGQDGLVLVLRVLLRISAPVAQLGRYAGSDMLIVMLITYTL